MALEFALRPRIRLSEGTAPPRRARRLRLPKLALPIAAYWLTAGGITYALIRAHEQPSSVSEAQPVVATATEEPARPWWQLSTAPTSGATATSEPEPALPALPATLPSTPDPTPMTAEPTRAQPSEESPPALLAPSREPHRSARRDQDAPSSSALAQNESELSALLAPALEREVPTPTPTPVIAPAPATAPDAPAVTGPLPSCEAAAASASQNIDLAHRDTSPDLSRAAIAAVLDNGVWIARCDIPMNTSIELCVAIQGGAVIGVSVSSHPASAAIDACLKRRAAGLHFPISSRVDLAKTRF